VLVLCFPVNPPRELRASLLTSAEIAIVELALSGASNRQIAELRGTSTRTVANQLSTVFKKLGITSRPELFLHCAGKRPGAEAEEASWRKTG
jgi:DNA-binding NarL/FixJ family response regulator